MAKSIRDNHKNKRRGPGRPKTTGVTPMTGVRLSHDLEARILQWAADQEDKPPKAEAIRRLLETALAASERVQVARDKSERMAVRAIDKIADPSAPSGERTRRKRRLVKGPSELRDLQRDVPKSTKRKR